MPKSGAVLNRHTF